MTSRTAPTLRALMEDLWAQARKPPPAKQKAGDAQVLRIAEAELRALLAVARAARKWRCEHKDEDCLGCQRVARALARLDRTRAPRRSGERGR